MTAPKRLRTGRIDPRRLAFDIDGVVADTMGLFLDILRDVYGINHASYEDITQYRLEACLDIEPAIIRAATERIIQGDYPCRLDPLPGAVEVLKRLDDFGPIRLITARPHPGPIPAWIAQLLPPERYRVDIISTGAFDAKPAVLKEAGIDVFVEDRLETCFLLQKHDIDPVVFVHPWNREPHPFLEVNGWDQLEELIAWP